MYCWTMIACSLGRRFKQMFRHDNSSSSSVCLWRIFFRVNGLDLNQIRKWFILIVYESTREFIGRNELNWFQRCGKSQMVTSFLLDKKIMHVHLWVIKMCCRHFSSFNTQPRALFQTFLSFLSVFINNLTQHLLDFMLQFMSRIIFLSDFYFFFHCLSFYGENREQIFLSSPKSS
jgi:hypothetical protein